MRGLIETIVVILWLLLVVFLVSLPFLFWGTIIYIASHFIMKFW